MGSMNGSKSERMNGLVGAEILLVLLMMICSVPYTRGTSMTMFKELLLGKPAGVESWNDAVEYSSLGDQGGIIKAIFTDEEWRDVVIKELALVTEAAVHRVPSDLMGRSVCFEIYNGSGWIVAMEQQKKKDEHRHHPCLQLLSDVVPIVKHLIKNKKLEHFVQIRYKSGGCTITPGVLSETLDQNSHTVRFHSSDDNILHLSEREEHVYHLTIPHIKGEGE